MSSLCKKLVYINSVFFFFQHSTFAKVGLLGSFLFLRWVINSRRFCFRVLYFEIPEGSTEHSEGVSVWDAAFVLEDFRGGLTDTHAPQTGQGACRGCRETLGPSTRKKRRLCFHTHTNGLVFYSAMFSPRTHTSLPFPSLPSHFPMHRTRAAHARAVHTGLHVYHSLID